MKFHRFSPVANADDLSFGFWPRQWRLIDADTGDALVDADQDEISSGGFDSSKFWKSVDGEVRSPDEFHTPKGLKSKKVKFEDVMSAMEYASKMKDEAYNLLSYNCTTFAREMYKIGTGSAAPSAGLLIEDPNTLYNSIWREAKLWGTKGAEVM